MNTVIRFCQLLTLLHVTTLQLHPMLRSQFLYQLQTASPALTTLPQELLISIQRINSDLAKQHNIAPADIDPVTHNTPDSLGTYTPCFNRISLGLHYTNQMPTFQLMAFLHEFGHHRQHQKGFFTNSTKAHQHLNAYPAEIQMAIRQDRSHNVSRPWQYYLEYDADLFAIQTIECSTCILLALLCSSTKQSENGYIGQLQITEQLKCFNLNNCCNAHSLDKPSAHKLRDIIRTTFMVKNQSNLELDNVFQQIVDLDRQCGPIEDRHNFQYTTDTDVMAAA